MSKPTISSEFKPAWWLTNRHAQTIWSSLPVSGAAALPLTYESLELPDGDVTRIDWAGDKDSTRPLLIILHGMEGSSESAYARFTMAAALRRGWRACVLHARDSGSQNNRLPRRYHAGETADLAHFLTVLQDRGDPGPFLAVGFSLGGNVLLKYLGEQGANTPIAAASAISAPFNLQNFL